MWVEIGVIFVLAFDSTDMGDHYLLRFLVSSTISEV
jgi:hypothetical protein